MAAPNKYIFETYRRHRWNIVAFIQTTNIPSLSPSELLSRWKAAVRKLKWYLEVGAEAEAATEAPPSWWTSAMFEAHREAYH